MEGNTTSIAATFRHIFVLRFSQDSTSRMAEVIIDGAGGI